MKAPWWDVETAYYVNERGFDEHKARTITIMRWLYNGDMRALAAAIDEGHEIDPAVLNVLSRLIASGRVSVKPKRGGSPRKPERFGRNYAISLAYADHVGRSDEAIDWIAGAVGMSEATVRQAITAFRREPTPRK
jgi:hypothetical protein